MKTSNPCKFEFYSKENDSGLVKAKVFILHEGVNRNKSNIDLEVIKKNMYTIINKPLLAYIEYSEDDAPIDFDGHNRKIVANDKGAYVQYLEKPLGIFSESCNPRIEQIDGVNHLVADCYLWDRYSNEALMLLEETDGKKQVSCEISVLESASLNNGILDILDFRLEGVTILGDNVRQGMNGTCGIELDFKDDTSFQEYFSELNAKIKEFEDKGSVEMSSKELLFGLGQIEVQRLISEQIKGYKYEYKDSYGSTYNFRKYFMIDLDLTDNVAIVQDDEDCTIKGIPFKIANENSVELDMENISNYVSVWKKADKEEEVLVYSNDNKEMLKEALEKEIQNFNEKDGVLKELQEELEKNKVEFEALSKENEELKEYKLNRIKEDELKALEEEVERITSVFSFKEEEIKDLKEKVFAKEMEIEMFEKELYALEGRKAIENKSKNKTKETKDALEVSYSLENDDEEAKKEQKRNLYGGLFKNLI